MPDPLTTSNDTDRRPTKKRALSPASRQAASVTALFANPTAALRSTDSKSHAPSLPPEIVTNVQGSSAGAGSGEFFVYKAARRREYERLAAMDAESQAEKAEEEYEKAREERRTKDEAKTGKNRARREKAKMRKEKKATGTDGALDGGGGEARKRLKANALPANAGGGDGTGTGAGEKEELKVVEEQGITIHED